MATRIAPTCIMRSETGRSGEIESWHTNERDGEGLGERDGSGTRAAGPGGIMVGAEDSSSGIVRNDGSGTPCASDLARGSVVAKSDCRIVGSSGSEGSGRRPGT